MNNNINCCCQAATFNNNGDLLRMFGSLRENCPALRDVFVPESVWPDFQRTAQNDFDEARHHYMLLGALESGNLDKLTGPVHRYLLDNGRPKTTLKKQYKNDLVEKWMLEKNHLERHRKARIFQGKLTELLIALFIEKQGWKINNLEALCGDSDIDAASPDDISCAIEVKYIGQEDLRYQEVVNSITSSEAGVNSINIYDGYNFFLFKSFDAAKQLSLSKKARLAFIIVSNQAWPFLSMPLADRWINNRPISFSDSASPDWINFLNQKKKEPKFSNIENELDSVITQLKELWIIREQNYFEYSIDHTISFSMKS